VSFETALWLGGGAAAAASSYFWLSILDCRTWRWYSIVLTSPLTEASLPVAAVAVLAMGTLVSFAPRTLAAVVFPKVEDMVGFLFFLSVMVCFCR
jgi:hypothetical protein